MTAPETPRRLSDRVRELDHQGAADRLENMADAAIAQTLSELGPGHAIDILEKFPAERRARIAAATATASEGEQWLKDWHYPEGSVGRLMEVTPAQFRPDTPVRDVVEAMREVIKRQLITYVFATQADGTLVGVVTFRELLYARPQQLLAEVMVRDPFYLRPETSLVDAMREVVTRHYPVYPVCDANGRLIGKVRGQVLFEQQAFEISAQAGSMVGVEKEERTTTPWPRALKFRHPWLQLNLLTAFIAAAVVGLFQDTVNHIVLLAVFLPVLSGQCSNTGCQALAVTLRGMTLGELKPGTERPLVMKETWVGCLNGIGVGVAAALGMYITATGQHQQQPVMLAFVVFLAMICSCMASGISGAIIPLTLKRFGFDPATASSIFLTTATDVVSMGMLLGLATILVR